MKIFLNYNLAAKGVFFTVDERDLSPAIVFSKGNLTERPYACLDFLQSMARLLRKGYRTFQEHLKASRFWTKLAKAG